MDPVGLHAGMPLGILGSIGCRQRSMALPWWHGVLSRSHRDPENQWISSEKDADAFWKVQVNAFTYGQSPRRAYLLVAAHMLTKNPNACMTYKKTSTCVSLHLWLTKNVDMCLTPFMTNKKHWHVSHSTNPRFFPLQVACHISAAKATNPVHKQLRHINMPL